MTDREEFTPGRAKGKSVAALAGKILDAHQIITDNSGTVYRYEQGAWAPLSDQHVLALALEAGAATPAKMADGLKYLKASTFQRAIPWGRVAEDQIACLNGIVDIHTGDLLEHDPEHYLERVLQVEYDPKAECPIWEQCLIDWFGEGDDMDRTLGLQTFFGYVATSHARYKKAVVLFGESDTGKTVPPQVAKMLVGEKYTCALSVADMDNPVRRSIIKGMALNMLTELPAASLIADGGFKTLVGTEEPISLDPKFKAGETYTPTAKHMIATNILPRLNDHTEATFNRLLIVPFDNVLASGKQNRDLLKDLRGELPGILNWAIKGLKYLVKNRGQWPKIRAAEAALKIYKDDLNPINDFIRERMERSPGIATPLFVVTREFNKWNTGAKSVGVKQLGRMLRSAGHGKLVCKVRHKEHVLSSLKGWRVSFDNDEALKVDDAPVPDGVAELDALPQEEANSDELDARGAPPLE